MNKNTTLRWILLFLIVLACLFYFVPWSTPFDLTLNATKLDSDGNEIGTTQITIRGKRLDYLFQKDRLDIEIEPFDGWSNFILSKDAHTGKKGVILNTISGVCTVSLAALCGNDPHGCQLYFTDSFDNFALSFIGSDEGKTTYLASIGDNHTADKVFDFFERFDFSHLPNRQT